MVAVAESRGHKVLPKSLFDAAEQIILDKDNTKSMISLAVNMSEPGCVDNIIKKDINFFKSGWKTFIGVDTHPVLVEIAGKALDIFDESGKLSFAEDDVNKIFEFFLSLYKVSLKMVLSQSGIEKMEKVDGMTLYHLRNILHPEMDSITLSHLLHKYRVRDIPTC